MRRAALPIFLFLAAAAHAAPPDIVERFDPASADFARHWGISGLLDASVRAARVRRIVDADGRPLLRIAVEPGDALDPPGGAVACDAQGSRAAALEAAGTEVGTERAEIQLRADRATGAGEVVRFGTPVWYRFDFRIRADNPRDAVAADREHCRTVIHQVKQDASREGAPCGASPFFKIEARPDGAGVQVFAQAAAGSACSRPAQVTRTRLCAARRPLDAWIGIHVRLRPAQDASGELDLWLDGAPCGSYRGPMGDPVDGLRRAGAPYVNVQPRFGLYRDRRAEPQGIDLRDLAIWTRDPDGDPAWGVAR
jgi:hypothetical protein